MKNFKPTRKLVDTLLDSPLGNIFLVTALQQHADSVIKYSAWLKDNDIESKEIISPHALASTAEEFIADMNQTFK